MRRMWGLLVVFLLAASAPAAADVPIDAEHFPDAAFRDYVKDFDLPGKDGKTDGVLSDEEIAAVKVIVINNDQIRSLKGIEYFTELEELRCIDTKLTFLDLSQNTALVSLYWHNYNLMTTLDVRSTKLEELYCHGNQLTALDVSGCTALKKLYCNGNVLTVLDTSKNTALESLDCNENQLTALDVSKNTALESLDCRNNQLTALDVSGCMALTSLVCSENQLTALDVHENAKLLELSCYINQLASLDLSRNTVLERLFCHDNRLTALDLSRNTKLDRLHCSINRLTFLDLQELHELSEVYVEAQTRDGLTVSAIEDAYVVDLGAFLPADRFGKVSDLAGHTSGGTRFSPQSFSNGKATFEAKPEKVTYRYDTGKDAYPMEVSLVEAMEPPVSPDIPVPNYRITVIPSDHGRITLQGSTEALSGDVIVSADSTVTFLVTADAGYEIAYLRDNAVSVDVPAGAARYEHTIPNVRTAHRLEAAFKAQSTPPVNPPAPPVTPPAPPSGPDVPPVTPPATPPAPPSSPDMPPVTPPVSPDVPPVTPPVSPDVPAPSPSGPVDIPSSANQWTIHWGARDAQGNVSVTVDVRIESESPLIAGSIRLEVSGIGKVRIVLLLDGQEVSSSGSYPVPARAAAQKRAYTLRITGTVPESARDTARIDAVRYKLEGSSEEKTVRLGTGGGGILLKDMTPKPETPEPDSGGGCDAGVSGLALALVGAFLLRKKV